MSNHCRSIASSGRNGLWAPKLLIALLFVMWGCTSRAPLPSSVKGPERVEFRVERHGTATDFVIFEGSKEVFRRTMSDWEIAEVSVDKERVDFDGDGQPELIVGVWEGQNSGDNCYVIGKRDGLWSVWLEFYRPRWESSICKNAEGRAVSISVPVRENGVGGVMYVYKHGRFECFQETKDAP